MLCFDSAKVKEKKVVWRWRVDQQCCACWSGKERRTTTRKEQLLIVLTGGRRWISTVSRFLYYVSLSCLLYPCHLAIYVGRTRESKGPNNYRQNIKRPKRDERRLSFAFSQMSLAATILYEKGILQVLKSLTCPSATRTYWGRSPELAVINGFR